MSTPEETVEAVLQTLDGLDGIEIGEHPARYATVHDELHRLLGNEPRHAT